MDHLGHPLGNLRDVAAFLQDGLEQPTANPDFAGHKGFELVPKTF
jgi:hypothetical protein